MTKKVEMLLVLETEPTVVGVFAVLIVAVVEER